MMSKMDACFKLFFLVGMGRRGGRGGAEGKGVRFVVRGGGGSFVEM